MFNPLSFPIKVPVRTYHPSKQVKDDAGNDVIFSNVRSSRSNDSHLDTVFIADVPAVGYAVYWLKPCWNENSDLPEVHIDTDVSAHDFSMENEYLKVSFNEHTGFITSLVDKKSGYDYASEDKPIAVPTVISDSKTDTWADKFFQIINEADWYMRTGNGFPPSCYSLFKLMWLKENQPELFSHISKILGSKDYINFRLTNNVFTDHSYASGFGAYDLSQHKIIPSFLDAAGIPLSIFPDIVPSHQIIGSVTVSEHCPTQEMS